MISECNNSLELQPSGPTVLRGRQFAVARQNFIPAYVKAHEAGLLKEKAAAGWELLRSCRVCRRNCRVNRQEEVQGVCRTGRRARVSSAFAHMGEEHCLRGWRGSGTIFFSGCNLGCVFCQNFDISQADDGDELDANQLAELMLRLQRAGCHNINFVTPSHVVPQILGALPLAVERGLTLPLIYNTGGYDGLESIRLLNGVIDVYMPDFKLWSPDKCALYLRAGDYADAARASIKEMHHQVGVLRFDEDGLALRGVLVRHLVMPNQLDETRSILRWLATELSRDTYVNVMAQYHPAHRVGTDRRYSEIQRPSSRAEYLRALRLAEAVGLWRLDTRHC